MQLIKYNNLVMNEGGTNLQRGMNFGIKGSYSIVLMSVEKNPTPANTTEIVEIEKSFRTTPLLSNKFC